jgi:predicted CXXCH cytochrome family protein
VAEVEKMRRTLAVAISLIAMYLALGSVALAGNPHADFTTNPDGCAACHRVHTATSGNLIKDPSGTAMCQTCHQGGAGADTDVMNGKYITSGESDHTWGDPNMNLLGGGFTTIQSTGTDVTSKHKMGVNMVPYGADPNTGPGAYVTLKCLSCHGAHPDRFHPNQYRLLRIRPNGSSFDRPVNWNGPWTDSTETVQSSDPAAYRAYTDKDWDSERPGTQVYTMNYKNGQDVWCVACHTRYTTRQDTTPYNAGDIFGNVMRYRHNTDSMISGVVDPINGLHYDLTTDLPLNHPTANPAQDTMSCLTCHRSHGTDAVMSATAAMDASDRGTLPLGSTLLRRNQRGVCTNCHANI